MKVVFEYDFGSALRIKLGKHKVFDKVEGWIVKVEIDDTLLKLLKANHDDKLIIEIVMTKGKKLCEEAEREMEKRILAWVDKYKKADKPPDSKAARLQMYKDIEDQLKEVRQKLQNLPKVQWNKLLTKVDERTKEYKKYKGEAIFDIVVSSGGLLLAGGAIASAAGSFGATAIPALIAAVRAGAKFAQSVKTLAEEAETVKNRAQTGIKEFVETYKEKRKARGADVAKAALNGVLGFNVATSVATLIKDVDLWGSKASGIYVAGVKFARLATEIRGGLKKSNADLNTPNLDPKLKAKMEKALEKVAKTFTTTFEKANASMARAKEAMKGLKEAKTNLGSIQGNVPGFLPKMDKIAGLLTDVALAAGAATAGFIEAHGEAVKLAAESIVSADEIGLIFKEAVG